MVKISKTRSIRLTVTTTLFSALLLPATACQRDPDIEIPEAQSVGIIKAATADQQYSQSEAADIPLPAVQDSDAEGEGNIETDNEADTSDLPSLIIPTPNTLPSLPELSSGSDGGLRGGGGTSSPLSQPQTEPPELVTNPVPTPPPAPAPSAPTPSPTSTPAPAPVAAAPIADGSYELRSANTSFCIDVPNSQTAAGVTILTFDCNHTNAQIFTFKQVEAGGIYRIINRTSGLTLTAKEVQSYSGDWRSGTRTSSSEVVLEQNVASTDSNQLFKVIPVANSSNFIIKLKNLDLAIDILTSTPSPYGPIKLLTTSSAATQQWTVTVAP